MDIFQELAELVGVSSCTSDAVGVNQVQAIIQKKLVNLGLETKQIQNPDPTVRSGDLLVAEQRGFSTRADWITLLCHGDTVFEKNPTFNSYRLTSDGKYATGPGVIDDKGGVIVLIEALRKLSQRLPEIFRKLPIRVVCSPNEETGSPGYLDFFKQLSASSKTVLGFEPAMESGSVVHSRKGDRWYRVRVTGKAAHAGRAHRDGINAAVELAHQLVKYAEITDYDRELTLNIGSISGGDNKFNVVCPKAEANLDLRFLTIPDGEEGHHKILKIASQPTLAGTKTSCDLVVYTQPFQEEAVSRKYLDFYLNEVSKIEGEPRSAERSGGSSDANHFWRPGLVVLDGLGPQGGKIHSHGEFLALDSMHTRSEAAFSLLVEIAKDY